MSGKDYGGPAFPFEEADGYIRPGMTLRDWFAGKNLPAQVSILEHELELMDDSDDVLGTYGQSMYAEIAERSYKMADAMLAERNK